jgi:uncharacterized protein
MLPPPRARPVRRAVLTALADTPVVCLLGPRQCGKSSLAQTFTPDRTYLTLDDEALLATARADPGGFVAALPDRAVVDEVQRAPGLLRALKQAVDRDRRPGRFLLTGSANLLLLPQLAESLAGRMEIVNLHPFTEAEKEGAAGDFLRALIEGGLKPHLAPSMVAAAAASPGGTADDLPARVVAGGFPEPVGRDFARARQWHRAYVRSLLERDVHEVARVRDVAVLGRTLELLALRNAELLNLTSLGNDLDLRRETVDHYLAVLERLFLVRRLPAWHRNEAKRLIKTPKVHVVDSGLAATLGGLAHGDWLTRRERFGHLLETFVVQQLIAQSGWTDPDLRFWHYRDKDQVEVDLVITRGRETWGVEVKASSSVSPSDGAGLRRLAEHAGRDFRGGVLMHSGTSALPLGGDPRLLAAPLAWLWTR